MSEAFLNSIVTVILAIIGVAVLAVLVSNQANTSGVIGAVTSGTSNLLKTAISPVTGGGTSSSLLQVPSFSGTNAGYNV